MNKKRNEVHYYPELKSLLLTISIVFIYLAAGINASYASDSNFQNTRVLMNSENPDNHGILNEAESKIELIAQQITVTGTVTDETNSPIPGVNIIIEGTTIGTITDLSGRFTINVPNEQSVLVLSFIGYTTISEQVGTQRQFNISLEPDVRAIDEVVVVGYGVQRKESVVGAISQATGDDIRQNVQGADLAVSLSGSVPGLITLRSTGRPGGADLYGNHDVYASMYIRGQKTWNDAAPLILVDGVERPLYNINPYEIEQLSVLKDASATAVFGVKGANGVILITTSRGQEGRARFTFDVTSTAKFSSRIDPKPTAYEANLAFNYAMFNEVSINPGSWDYVRPQRWVELTRDKTYPYYLPDVDWQKELLKDYTIDNNLNLTVSGGTKLVKYFGSVSYLNESDILNIRDVGRGYDPGFSFDRANFRNNMDFDITSTTRFSTNLAGSYYRQKRSSATQYGFWGLWGAPPDMFPVNYADGVYGYDEDVINASNPIMEFVYSGIQIAKGTNITTDFVLDQKLNFFTQGLSANLKVAYDYNDRNQGPNVGGQMPISKYIRREIVDEITPGMTDEEIRALEEKHTIWNVSGIGSHGYDWAMGANNFHTESALSSGVYRSLLYQASLNYARDFGKHAVTSLALVSRQETARGSTFPNYREDWVGRVTYAFDRRYLFETNMAYNGSEKFDRKNRFGFFPSMAVGWIISNEAFFENLKPVFNNFKIRYSDGKVGSDAGIDRWLYTSSWIVHPVGAGGQTIWQFGTPTTVASPPLRYEGVIPNLDIKWETSRKRDWGIETGFFSNQLTLNFDYFIENRTDMFVTAADRVIPDYFGSTAVSGNIGKVDVKGWELETQFRKVTTGGFTYSVSYSWAYAKDKIILKADPELLPFFKKAAGYAIGQRRAYLPASDILTTWNDIYNTLGPEVNPGMRLPGDVAIMDFNADGRINVDDTAPTSYASRPQYSYALGIGASFKNLSANMRFYGVYNIAGGVGDTREWWSTDQNQANVAKYLIDESWSPEIGNTESAFRPALRGLTNSRSRLIFPFYEESRSFLRLESAEIAYTLTSSASPLINRIGINNLRVALRGNNLLLISKMRTDQDHAGTGDGRSNYPVLRRISLGLSMNF